MAQLNKNLAAIVAAAIVAGVSGGVTALAYPQSGDMQGMLDLNSTSTASSMNGNMWDDMNNTAKNMGMITGTTNDGEGNPAWLVAGHWWIAYTPNSTAIGSDMNSGNVSDFGAKIIMVRFNGSAMHTHEISNFTQQEEATFNSTSNSTTYVGTSTVTLRDGPVNSVLTTLTVSDNILKIQLEQIATGNHFGSAPIYGVVVPPELHKMCDMMSQTMTQGLGSNMTGMHDRWSGNSTRGMMSDMWK